VLNKIDHQDADKNIAKICQKYDEVFYLIFPKNKVLTFNFSFLLIVKNCINKCSCWTLFKETSKRKFY